MLLLRTALFLFVVGACYGADLGSLYDSARLTAEQVRLQTSMNLVLEREIVPVVRSEQATIIGLQPLDLPLEGLRTDPLDFYAEKSHIVIPIRTLLFVEDLSRAYGWLWTDRYSTKTVDEYLNMLRYRSAADFPGGRLPGPLEALHIPADALSNTRVVETSVRIRKTAYAFLFLHQLGHLQLNHNKGPKQAYSEAEEEAADEFALNIMKANSATPTGILVLMWSGLYLETGTGSALHPVSGQRMDAIAHYMGSHVLEFIHGRSDQAVAMSGIHSIASLLNDASQWLAIKSHREELQSLALKTDPSTLQPRPLPKSTF